MRHAPGESVWLRFTAWVTSFTIVALAFVILPACEGGADGDLGITGSTGATGSSAGSVENEDGNPDPLSSVVSLSLTDAGSTGAADIPAYMKALVNHYVAGTLAAGTEFPLANASTDTVRALKGLSANVVAKWLDPLQFSHAGRVHLINDAVGAAGNVAIAETVGNSGFSVSGMSGGSATAFAKGTINAALPADTQTFTIGDGVNPATVFEFDSGGGVSGANVAVAFTATDTVAQLVESIVRAINGVTGTLAVSAAREPVFGANCDYIAYFGDGWDAVAGNVPQWNGSGTSGWIWVNHEYVSTEAPGNAPAIGVAPKGQALTLAKAMWSRGTLTADPALPGTWTAQAVDNWIREYRRHMGGSWIHILKDPSSGSWHVDRSAPNQRFDGTSNTLLFLTGSTLSSGPDTDDFGNALATGVLTGTLANCSGGQSPWGTIFSGEENPQDYFGDFEAAWNSSNQFQAGQGYNPGAVVAPSGAPSASGQLVTATNAAEQHDRDVYGWLVEIDPTRPPSEFYNRVAASGNGHRKMGSFGRIRWENTAFVTDTAWKLIPNQPVVMYGGDDRRAGRVYRWVSGAPYTAGMTKAQVRALLDTGELYVAQFDGVSNADGWKMTATGAAPTEAAPGSGRWIRLSTTSTDVAPNAAILGAGTTVATALASTTWNNIGAFDSNDKILRSLFTACAKLGVFEMNRPEDVEWNPVDRQLYVALTNFAGRPAALGQTGVLGTVALTADANGANNNAIAETVATARFIVSGMSGGAAAARATGFIYCPPGSDIVDAETFTINDGVNTVVFEFELAGGVAGGNTAVAILAADTAQQVATKVQNAINGVAAGLTITAAVPPNRTDTVGRIWTLKEANQSNPGVSATFTFWEVWGGTAGSGVFDAANPDNLLIDKSGGVWFGTDGNFGTSGGRADAYYYLDLNPAHKAGAAGVVNPGFGKAFRFMAVPSDAEATGPAFNADMKTFFSGVQHPGESVYSTWP